MPLRQSRMTPHRRLGAQSPSVSCYSCDRYPLKHPLGADAIRSRSASCRHHVRCLYEGTKDVFNGKDTKQARRSCPSAIWLVARRKLNQLNAAVARQSLRIPRGNEWVC